MVCKIEAFLLSSNTPILRWQRVNDLHRNSDEIWHFKFVQDLPHSSKFVWKKDLSDNNNADVKWSLVTKRKSVLSRKSKCFAVRLLLNNQAICFEIMLLIRSINFYKMHQILIMTGKSTQLVRVHEGSSLNQTVS